MQWILNPVRVLTSTGNQRVAGEIGVAYSFSGRTPHGSRVAWATDVQAWSDGGVFAGLPRPSCDRALCALRFWLDSWPGIGAVAIGNGPAALRPSAYPVRREGLEGDVLHERDALAHERDGYRVGTYAVARCPGSGAGRSVSHDDDLHTPDEEDMLSGAQRRRAQWTL